jgi:acetyl esterase/lipase
MIIGIVTFYPCVDLSLKTAIRSPPPVSEGNTNIVTPSFIEVVRGGYTPHGTDMSDPRLSPVNTPFTALPEHVFFAVCEEDPLRLDAVSYAKQLKKDGIKVVLKDIAKVVHAWDKRAKKGTPAATAKHDSYEAAVEFLKMIYGTRSED